MKLSVTVDPDGHRLTAIAEGYAGVPAPEQLGQLLAELVTSALRSDDPPARPPCPTHKAPQTDRQETLSYVPPVPDMEYVPRPPPPPPALVADVATAAVMLGVSRVAGFDAEPAPAAAEPSLDDLRRTSYEMFDNGRSVAQVAAILRMDRDTVRSWRLEARRP